MTVRPKATERALRLMDRRPETAAERSWFHLTVNAAAKTADVYLYDEIGYWGTSAAEFCSQLAALDVKAITLRINSPGGEVFDGIAIHNALIQHKASIAVSVDGVAASIASVIAMAGDTITMQAGSQMMIHDASGVCAGNAADMAATAALLDKLSDTIAGFYAAKVGGSLTSWRDTMKRETWYSADEAVTAGLATSATSEPAPENSATPRHAWDLRDTLGYRYANRSEAPAPSVIDRTETAEIVELSPLDLEAMRDALTPPALAPMSLADFSSAIDFGLKTVPALDPPVVPQEPPAVIDDALMPLDIRDMRTAVREARQ